MTIFDETQHPRSTDGAFALKFQSAPEATLSEGRTQFVSAGSLAASNDVSPQGVRVQVELRMGERELDDDVAIAGVRYLAEKYADDEDMSDFADLARTGVTRTDGIGQTIGSLYSTDEYRDRRLMDMLGTWALSKQRD